MCNNTNCLGFLLTVIWATLLTSCQPGKLDSDDAGSWSRRSVDGLSFSRRINGFEITVRFLSPEYLADLAKNKMGRQLKAGERDSLIRQHSGTLTFLMTLAPEETRLASEDIVTQGIASQPEFAERLTRLNFHMDEMIALRIGDTDIAPVLTSMESTGGLTNHRNIHIVFENSSRVASNSDSVAIVFRDDLFDTGTSYFPFPEKVFYENR